MTLILTWSVLGDLERFLLIMTNPYLHITEQYLCTFLLQNGALGISKYHFDDANYMNIYQSATKWRWFLLFSLANIHSKGISNRQWFLEMFTCHICAIDVPCHMRVVKRDPKCVNQYDILYEIGIAFGCDLFCHKSNSVDTIFIALTILQWFTMDPHPLNNSSVKAMSGMFFAMS